MRLIVYVSNMFRGRLKRSNLFLLLVGSVVILCTWNMNLVVKSPRGERVAEETYVERLDLNTGRREKTHEKLASVKRPFTVWSPSTPKNDVFRQKAKDDSGSKMEDEFVKKHSAGYIAYIPHSGLGNQWVELENALVIAAMLNRTLVLPPVYLGMKSLNSPVKYL